MAALAFSGRLPWSAALHALLEEAEDSLGVEPEAPEWYTVPPRYGKGEEGARAHEREGRRLSSQSRAAYTLAVASALLSRSDKAEHLERSTVYARHGIAILNAWSHNRDMGANAEPFERKQTALVTATSGPGLLIAADILYKHPAWSGEDRDRFLAWVRDVVREASAIKTISYNNNWNTWGLYLSMLCAHLLEDADTFTADVALWRKDVFHHIIEDGRMPKELARGGGRNWYTYYALVPITTAAVL
ncbi:MAG: alginate lyase family protein, partial [Kiritimatiellae bacterium]|nr:alginate lyase family protein [Kiritimatiellia bacterium]